MSRPSWLLLAAAVLAATSAYGADWPQWGGRDERNFVSDEKGLPTSFNPGGERVENQHTIIIPPEHIKWVADLGTQTYGNPTISGGRVFIGTNDANLRDPRLKKTGGGLVLCLDEATGRLLWQLPVPRLKTKDPDFNFDDMKLGLCSSPTVDGDRVYLVTNRAEVLCLDVRGQANGNDGPFMEEGQYMVGPGDLPAKPGRFDPKDLSGPPAPVEVKPTDGDILWRFDMLAEVDSWPQNAADCSVLVHGDYVYACTSNGVDKSHKTIRSPQCPDLVVLDKKTGRLAAVSESPVGKAIFHGTWSSPSLAMVGEKPLVVWGGGDGVCYGFDAAPAPGAAGKPGLLKKVWWFDGNPPEYRVRDGKKLPYNKNREGPSEIIATPVSSGGRIYVSVGQDSRHGDGLGALSCIDPTKSGDISQAGKVWQSEAVHRTFSTASVAGGLVFVVDYGGRVYCLDADTGEVYWTHKLGAHVWGSTLVADGKVYLGDESGKLTLFAAAREKKILNVVSFDSPIYTSPVAANGVLYVATQTHLYAIQSPKP